MREIWFSHDYDKLPRDWEDSEAVLISVCELDRTILDNNPFFSKYDTKFRDVDAFYPLSFDLGIILLFYHPGSHSIFTTIRSYSNNKFKYYFDLIGEKFVLRRRS